MDQVEKMPDGKRAVYDRIWSADVPPKVRIFAWRLSQEGLATRRWHPPPNGWVNVNTDAGFYVETGEASAGIIIRSESGQVLLSAQKVLRKCSSAEEAEAEACLEGIKLAVTWIHHN
jgi:hypothetical protein